MDMAPATYSWSPEAFRDRFTPAERAEIRRVGRTDEILADLWETLICRTNPITSDSTELRAGLAYAAQVGVLQASRVTELLTQS